MRIAHRIGIAVMTAALAAGSRTSRAGGPHKPVAEPPVDEKLLEFLGSVDASADPGADSGQPDDGSWLAYLSQVNIGRMAKSSQAAKAGQTPQPKPVSAAAGADKPGG
ncbi:MAG TPA: hypothetical protein VFN79_01410 [Steroidobacteraceae bacterium]|nr:hypothetical protein [Steroidobacteraceae bacterium]